MTSHTTLLKAARSARRRAHAPYSRFKVGAALLTSSGKVVPGCNVENSSYGLTVCAERVALFTAIAQGYSSFRAIAISTDSGEPIPPCGACRQVLADHAPDLVVILDAGSTHEVFSLASLLPRAFRPAHLLKRASKRR